MMLQRLKNTFSRCHSGPLNPCKNESISLKCYIQFSSVACRGADNARKTPVSGKTGPLWRRGISHLLGRILEGFWNGAVASADPAYADVQFLRDDRPRGAGGSEVRYLARVECDWRITCAIGVWGTHLLNPALIGAIMRWMSGLGRYRKLRLKFRFGRHTGRNSTATSARPGPATEETTRETMPPIASNLLICPARPVPARVLTP